MLRRGSPSAAGRDSVPSVRPPAAPQRSVDTIHEKERQYSSRTREPFERGIGSRFRPLRLCEPGQSDSRCRKAGSLWMNTMMSQGGYGSPMHGSWGRLGGEAGPGPHSARSRKGCHCGPATISGQLACKSVMPLDLAVSMVTTNREQYSRIRGNKLKVHSIWKTSSAIFRGIWWKFKMSHHNPPGSLSHR